MKYNFTSIVENHSAELAERVKLDITEEMQKEIVGRVERDGIYQIPLKSETTLSNKWLDRIESTCLVFEKINEDTIDVYFHINEFNNIK